ncbi:MAG: hypothetical protein ACHQ51_02235 [Elusimicrobiota bacterium]
MSLPRPSAFLRKALIFTALHGLAFGAAMFALLVLTDGGGESYRDSSAIDAVGAILQALHLPFGWLIGRLFDPQTSAMRIAAIAGAEMANGLSFGALAAWAWMKVRPDRSKTA